LEKKDELEDTKSELLIVYKNEKILKALRVWGCIT